MSSSIGNFFQKLFGRGNDLESETKTNRKGKRKYFKRQSVEKRFAMLDLNTSEVGFQPYRKDKNISHGQIIIVLKDKFGHLLGPGHGESIQIIGEGVNVVEPVDHMDGSYSMAVEVKEPDKDPVVMIVAEGHEKPLWKSKFSKVPKV